MLSSCRLKIAFNVSETTGNCQFKRLIFLASKNKNLLKVLAMS